MMIERTPPRGWAVILLFRAQQSSVILVSYTFGLFLPFIREDLDISPVQAGLLQAVWWITAAGLSLPFGAWFSRFRPVPLALVSLVSGGAVPVRAGVGAGVLGAAGGPVLLHPVSHGEHARPRPACCANGAPRINTRWCSRWGCRSTASYWPWPSASARG